MDRHQATQRRRHLKAQAVEFLGGRCAVCGYDRCSEALDFHHLDPHQKDFEIGRKLASLPALVPELVKCVLLCATCHREVHAGLHPRYLTLDEPADGFFSE